MSERLQPHEQALITKGRLRKWLGRVADILSSTPVSERPNPEFRSQSFSVETLREIVEMAADTYEKQRNEMGHKAPSADLAAVAIGVNQKQASSLFKEYVLQHAFEVGLGGRLTWLEDRELTQPQETVANLTYESVRTIITHAQGVYGTRSKLAQNIQRGILDGVQSLELRLQGAHLDLKERSEES